MASDPELYRLAARLGRRLLAARWQVTAAESCTGGWIAKALTDVAGSSQWFASGYVTYSNEAKVRELGVAPRTLQRYGAVSEQTVREMARGVLRAARAQVAVAVSGIAGPDGGSAAKPVGTVWLCVAVQRGRGIQLSAARSRFKGDRAAVRRKAVARALRLLLQATGA
jgi:nicotinamide-nucleotide amidase